MLIYESLGGNEIHRMCEDYDIKRYSINADMSIDVNRGVNLEKKLGQLGKLPIAFNIIKGDFLCGYNNLTSLEGCPNAVYNGLFACSNNKITSLQYSPKEVGFLKCSYNRFITSLEGLEDTYIDYSLDVSGCGNLFSLRGFPKKLKKFDCFGTPIEPIYYKFIQESDPVVISIFNRLRVIGTDGLDWWVYYDQLGKFLRSVDKKHLVMSEKDFDDFIKTTKYSWDY
jgi:hypothetical protein